MGRCLSDKKHREDRVFMAFKDLREYIAELESRGLLKRITTEVDCQLEITEIRTECPRWRVTRM